MRQIDLSFNDPAENLAFDEVLLNGAEAGQHGPTLRFWESPTPFVVLGLTQAVSEHVDQDACARDGVAILRRCSAGGCVLQGPGCLNFSLVLSQDSVEYATIRSSYRSILGGIAQALTDTLKIPIEMAGVSDLALKGRKVSGNAQRRRRRFFLHHGTLLYGADTALYSRYLHEPTDRPDYRKNRRHPSFTANLPTGPDELRGIVSSMFREAVSSEITAVEKIETQQLAEGRYRDAGWVYRK